MKRFILVGFYLCMSYVQAQNNLFFSPEEEEIKDTVQTPSGTIPVLFSD